MLCKGHNRSPICKSDFRVVALYVLQYAVDFPIYGIGTKSRENLSFAESRDHNTRARLCEKASAKGLGCKSVQVARRSFRQR